VLVTFTHNHQLKQSRQLILFYHVHHFSNRFDHNICWPCFSALIKELGLKPSFEKKRGGTVKMDFVKWNLIVCSIVGPLKIAIRDKWRFFIVSCHKAPKPKPISSFITSLCSRTHSLSHPPPALPTRYNTRSSSHNTIRAASILT